MTENLLSLYETPVSEAVVLTVCSCPYQLPLCNVCMHCLLAFLPLQVFWFAGQEVTGPQEDTVGTCISGLASYF